MCAVRPRCQVCPPACSSIRHPGQKIHLTTVFLDATTDTLVRRFSETRRRHPLSLKSADDQHRALTDAIEYERELLSELRDQALVLDTSLIRAAQLRSQIKDVLGAQQAPLTLVFESFAFKRGIPMDADFVFDVRMLPNPHYETLLQPPERAATRRWRDFLAGHARGGADGAADRCVSCATGCPSMLNDHRSYVTVAIGCTGGQHRSVYLVERLAQDIFSRLGHTPAPPRGLDSHGRCPRAQLPRPDATCSVGQLLASSRYAPAQADRSPTRRPRCHPLTGPATLGCQRPCRHPIIGPAKDASAARGA